VQEAVERVIETMWLRHGERLSLEEMANTAFFSRFYFSRTFRSLTGTSPGRFLTAIRLYNAKQLLAESTLSVTEISYQVGYSSLGTFTTRFTQSVGMSPVRYRMLLRAVRHGQATASELPSLVQGSPSQSHTVVHGRVTVPASEKAVRVYVGAFASSMPQGLPSSCDIIDVHDGVADLRLPAVPPGVWHVHAAAVPNPVADTCPTLRKPLFVHSGDPLTVQPGADITLDIELRAVTPLDIPVLFALPDLDWRLQGADRLWFADARAGSSS
jgi:AraC-like DNA-binding protein